MWDLVKARPDMLPGFEKNICNFVMVSEILNLEDKGIYYFCII